MFGIVFGLRVAEKSSIVLTYLDSDKSCFRPFQTQHVVSTITDESKIGIIDDGGVTIGIDTIINRRGILHNLNLMIIVFGDRILFGIVTGCIVRQPTPEGNGYVR